MDNGQWGYEITKLGCDVLKEFYGVEIAPAPYGFIRIDSRVHGEQTN
jgi:hypothetical protein